MKITNSRRVAQTGFSLVELLIGIAIGLVILTAIGLVYVSSSNINRQKEDMTDVTEPAKIVANLLRANISSAGYIDPFDYATAGTAAQGANFFTPGNPNQANMFVRNASGAISTPLEQIFAGLRPVFGCDGAMMSTTPNALATAAPPVTLTCGTANATQNSLQVAYQIRPLGGTGDNSKTLPSLRPASETANTGEDTDCLGQALPGTTSIVVNRFYVASNDGVNELYCAGSGNATPLPLARGVEEFVVRYQMTPVAAAPANPASEVFVSGDVKAQYLTATQVAASAIGWAGVTAIEVCMVTATAPSRGGAAAGTVQLQSTRPTCEREAASNAFKSNIARASGDARLWKRFTFTYSVRSAIFSTPVSPV